jgi:hypothetical protein
MSVTKENCKFLKITSINKETGEEVISAFIKHPDYKVNIKLSVLNEDKSKMSFDEILAYCKANPEWRTQLKPIDGDFGVFFTLSQSVVEEMAV